MNNGAIGVFDSGLGGLTCVKELNELMPDEDIVYFGDTARIPYGTRSRETILKYTSQAINFLRTHNVKMIIAACGTVSSVIETQKPSIDIPFMGVLLPAAQAACAVTRTGRIGAIGTSATIRSGSYGKAIRTIRPDAAVIGNACPLFVPLVENGFVSKDNEITKLVIKQYLAPIKSENVDTLILGCTHYPIIKDAIAEFMGDGVRLISPGAEAAKSACAYLSQHEERTDREGSGTNTFFVSDSTDTFEENAALFMGSSAVGSVTQVDVSSY